MAQIRYHQMLLTVSTHRLRSGWLRSCRAHSTQLRWSSLISTACRYIGRLANCFQNLYFGKRIRVELLSWNWKYRCTVILRAQLWRMFEDSQQKLRLDDSTVGVLILKRFLIRSSLLSGVCSKFSVCTWWINFALRSSSRPSEGRKTFDDLKKVWRMNPTLWLEARRLWWW